MQKDCEKTLLSKCRYQRSINLMVKGFLIKAVDLADLERYVQRIKNILSGIIIGGLVLTVAL